MYLRKKAISFFVFVSFLLMTSCVQRMTSPTTGELQPKIQMQYNSTDTILAGSDIYLSYVNLSDEEYLIRWGTENFENQSSDTIHNFPDGRLKLEWYNDRAICVRQGCGTACFYAYVLPLKRDANEIMYMYPLAFDTVNNLIAYNGDDNEHLIIIENFINGKKMFLDRDFLPGPFPGYAIDSISFLTEKGKIYLRWKDSKENEISEVIEINDL